MRSIVSRLGLVAFVGVGAVAGCGGGDASTAVQGAEVVDRPDDAICATLDYAHAQAPADYYRFFETDAKAGAFMDAIIQQGRLADLSGPTARFKEISTDPHLVKLVQEVFDGFKKVFPKETAGLTTPPRIAVVESEIINAFALGPGFAEDASAPTDRSPWVFIVHTAALNNGNTDTELRGLFAHELGHLILRTFLPEIQRRVRSIYMLGPAGEDGILGAVQEDAPEVAAHVERILELQGRVGGLPQLGYDSTRRGHYAKVLDLMMKQVPATAPEAAVCASVKAKVEELTDLQIALLPGAPIGNLVPATPTGEQQAKLDALSASLRTEIPRCIAPLDEAGSLLEFTAAVNKLPPEAKNPEHPDHAKLVDLTTDIEQRVDAEMPDAKIAARLIAAEPPTRAAQAALRADPAFPIDRIRVFDYEEDADDAAIRVLSSIGDDPLGISGFLLSTVAKDARDACVAHVAAGKPASFGQFIDSHAPLCWRHYHATQFAKALATCSPAAAARKVQPKGSGRESVVDRVKPTNPGYGVGRR
jgi:hypothetical protein